MDAGLHRPERNASRLGDLTVGHPRDLFEHQRFPLVLRKPPKRRFHFGAAADVLFRRGASGFLPWASGRLRHFEQPSLPACTAQCIVGGTNRDPAEPGSHGSFAPVAGRPAEGAQVGLLGGVFGFGAIPQDGEGDGSNPGLGTANEVVEGADIALVPEAPKQPALFGVFPGSFLLTWIIRRVLWFLRRKTHRTRPFVRAGQECAAV